MNKRGFLDRHRNARPLSVLAEHYARTRQYRDALPRDNPHVGVEAAVADAAPVPTLAVVDRCPDPDCRGDMVMKDGCPTCLDCGYSNCG